MLYGHKLDLLIDYPIDELNLSRHESSHNTTAAKSNGFCEGDVLSEKLGGIGDACSPPIYDLFGVCNHYGRMGFGHYTAFARDLGYATSVSDSSDHLQQDLAPIGQWYEFDDDSCEIVNGVGLLETYGALPNALRRRIVSSSAYLLFYRRRPNVSES
jgi:hypothetical protein